jgi:hypothetical protein
MSASTDFSTLIVTRTRRDGRGVFVATSPNLKGLLVVSKDKETLEKTLIPQAIADLYAACGVKMIVTRIAEDDDPADRWVATPLDAIKAAERALTAA